MKGTDQGGSSVWTYILELGQRLVDYGRALTAQPAPDVQELIAYRTAERLREAAGLDGGYRENHRTLRL